MDLEQACKSSLTSAACTAHVNEARNYIAWTDANGHRFDVNIGQFYHPGLLGKGKAGLDQSIIQAIEEKPQVTSLDDLRDSVHKLNQAGLFTGYFGEASDLKHQGQLMDEFGRLNDKNDPLVQVPCGRSPVPCYSNRRSEIRGELSGYGIKDFFVPRSIGGVIFEVGTAGAGTLIKFGGKTFLRVGDNLLEATADGAGGYKVATNTGAEGFYDPRVWRQNYEDFYDGNVTSTTVPPYSASNVRLAGQTHPRTGVVFDQRGFPIFDDVARYDTRIPADQFRATDYQGQMRLATRDLRDTIATNPQLRSRFTQPQLDAIQGGRAKIPDFTWHHHQDTGRMQLVPSATHRRTGHIGGESLSGGQ